MIAVFNKLDGSFAGGAARSNDNTLSCDPATQVLVTLPDNDTPSVLIDGRVTRWDGATGVRAATGAEQAAWDLAHPVK